MTHLQPHAIDLVQFRNALLSWFFSAGRKLPWRKTADPYLIWVSEVVLQQTRVEQGLPYYQRFVERFPTVRHLAEADEKEVLSLWQGLGYYSRARNMHRAARLVCLQFECQMPADYKGLKALPGIGPYTAAAIASIAFAEPVSVVDGNVYRVLARLFACETPINAPKAFDEYQGLATRLLSPEKPGPFNEAMMELGATVCTPRLPACPACPVAQWCLARQQQAMESFPKKRPKAKATEVSLHYLLVYNGTHLLLHRRDDSSIWKNMYELVPASPGIISMLEHGKLKLQPRMQMRHQLTHRLLHISTEVFRSSEERLPAIEGTEAVPFEKLDDFPLPVPFRKMIYEHISAGYLL